MHLINVTPLKGVLEFNRTGTFRGNCTHSCHGRQHNSRNY